MNPLQHDSNIASAKTLTKDFYTDPHYFELSKEKIFAKAWHYVGNVNELSVPGNLKPVVILDEFMNEPLLLSKDKAEQLHCLSNVCTHRGALLINEPCQATDIRCPYHGRRFNLNGKFLSMPEFKEVENFPSPADDLAELPLFEIGPLLFTSLTDALPAKSFFSEMMSRIGWMPLQQLVYKPELSKSYSINAHWALYCENYLEGFHIPFVHASLNQVIDFGSYSTELFQNASLQLGIAKQGQLVFDLPESSPDFGKSVGAYYFWVFPNLMFNFYPWGLSLNVVKPIAPQQTKVEFHTFIWDESLFNKGAGSDLNRVEMEDEAVVESVQRGIRSRFYSHGRYSVKHETGTHHLHQLLKQFLS
jgi:choline monooxygenase